jgi:ferric-dicitrate binding protein FerR (iron transport regulator)
MNDDQNLITELILKYIRGEALTEEESQVLEAWRARSEDNRRLPDQFRDKEWVEERMREMPPVPTEVIWAMIQQRTIIDRRVRPVIQRRPLHVARVVAAAGLLALAGIGGSYLLQRGYTGGEQPAVVAKAIGPGHLHEALRRADGTPEVYDSCGRAGPFDLQLPDGSQVKLAYGSSVRYAATFGGHSREVYLTGQAEFDVTSDKDKPFIVHAGPTSVTVLGTRFNVMAYAGDASEITLLRGSVTVSYKDLTLALKPADQAIVSGDKVVRRRLEHPDGAIGWEEQDPYFEFDDVDLVTALQRLARWYQVKVYNPEHVTGASITGIFNQTQSLDMNLAHIGDAERGNARVTMRNDTIFLSSYPVSAAHK